MAEQRWGNNHLRDKSAGSVNGNWSEDEEDHDVNHETECEKDRDDEEDNETEGEKDRDDAYEEDNDKSDVTGISAWDLLGDGFECEATSIGMSLVHDSDSSTYLTIV